MEGERLFYYLAGVPLLGIVTQWLAWRFKLPAILLLLAFGMALGAFIDPDVLLAKVVDGDESVGPALLLPIVSLSVAVILFEGGLSLKFRELRESGRDVLRLCTLGMLVSWTLTTIAAWLIFNFHTRDSLDFRLAALLGAVLVVTGPTVIGPLLRHVRPHQRVGSVVKWEGVCIDPVGAVLAVLVFEVIKPGGESSAWTLAKTIVIGSVLGVATSAALIQLVKRFLIPDFLQGAVFLTAALAVFALSNGLQPESGLVTVTLMGVVLANQKSISIRHVSTFKENLVILLLSCLFIVLGSRIDPMSIVELGVPGALFVLALIVIVRPVSVFVATLGSALSWRERTFVGFMAPRGIVAAAVMSVFALEAAHLGSGAGHAAKPPPAAAAAQSPATDRPTPLDRMAAQARQLVPLTFLVIVATVAVYGLLARPVARLLKLADPDPQGVLFAGADKWIRDIASALKEEQISVVLMDTNYRNVTEARIDGLTAHCISVLSEHAHDEVDLSGIGKLLAMTPNDEVNSLSVLEFAHIFERASVYQLAPLDLGAGKRESLGEHLRGRLLFSPDATYRELAKRFAEGEIVKRTRLGEEFTYQDFTEHYGESALIMFVITETKKLVVCTAGKKPDPQSGQTIVALVKPV